ncbi:MAG: FGGY family carbohydrate kinase [bacterium]|nr:FGGY family carbohydrate kinase [bacterium]
MSRKARAEKDGLVIGLDSSTTAAKAIAFDAKGRIVSRASRSIPMFCPVPGAYEQDPEDWWASAAGALSAVCREIDPSRVRALAISNQRETFVPLDGSGRPVRPAIVWLDERCRETVGPFSRAVGPEVLHRVTGKPVDYAPVVYRLAWMKKREPGRFRGTAMFCDVQSWLVHRLTGVFATSWAAADPLGLFDTRRKVWSPVILSALGLSADRLPAAVRPGTIIGRVTMEASKRTGLRPGTPVAAGGGDGQAAGLGVNALSPSVAYVNLGTAVVAGVYNRRYRVHRAFRTMVACCEDGYVYECSLRAGTFSTDWFIRNILRLDPRRNPEIYATLEREAERAGTGSGGVLYLPYLCGAMNPHWDMDAAGAFVGLRAYHHRGHLYRSMLEGIAFEQRFALEAVGKAAGTRVRECVVIGGGASSVLWRHILADVTGKTVRVPRSGDASALGAAIAAAVAAGWHKTFRQAAKAMTGMVQSVVPDPKKRREYDMLYRAYVRMHPALKRIRL